MKKMVDSRQKKYRCTADIKSEMGWRGIKNIAALKRETKQRNNFVAKNGIILTQMNAIIE